MSAPLRFVKLALLLAAPLALAADLPIVQLQIGIHLIQAELAATDEARTMGLMHREHLEKNRGMLFVFPKPAIQAMWMKNTLIPLAVAFIDDRGRIINIEEMRPNTLDAHAAKGPARYALEMNGGWFRERGISPGAVVKGLPP